jgi:hypothetical protein
VNDGLVHLVRQFEERAELGDGFELGEADLNAEGLAQQAKIGFIGKLDRRLGLAIDDGDISAEGARSIVSVGKELDERSVGLLEANSLQRDGEVKAHAGPAEKLPRLHHGIDPGADLLADLRDAALREAELSGHRCLRAALVGELVIDGKVAVRGEAKDGTTAHGNLRI